jgi:hypothetical protein
MLVALVLGGPGYGGGAEDGEESGQVPGGQVQGRAPHPGHCFPCHLTLESFYP